MAALVDSQGRPLESGQRYIFQFKTTSEAVPRIITHPEYYYFEKTPGTNTYTTNEPVLYAAPESEGQYKVQEYPRFYSVGQSDDFHPNLADHFILDDMNLYFKRSHHPLQGGREPDFNIRTYTPFTMSSPPRIYRIPVIVKRAGKDSDSDFGSLRYWRIVARSQNK